MPSGEWLENYSDLPLMLPAFVLIGLSVYLAIPVLLWVGLAMMVGSSVVAPQVMEIRAASLKVIRAVNYDDGLWDDRKNGITNGYGKSLLTFVYKGTPQEERISRYGGRFGMGQWKTSIACDSPREKHPRFGPMDRVEFTHDLPLANMFRHDEGGWFTYFGFQIKGKVVHVITVRETYVAPLHPRIEDGGTVARYHITGSSGIHDMEIGRYSMREIEQTVRALERSGSGN